MRDLVAFVKKEGMEHLRSGRLTVLVLMFALLGVLNPALAKLTPWLLETVAEEMAGSGITVTAVTVSARDSWVQFFKNLPLGLIAFLVLESNIFTKEYGQGTLVPVLTKGLSRYKVLLSKAAVLWVLWSGLYWLCFGITYGYTAYFWDNSAVSSLGSAAVGLWIFGWWCVALTVLFSTVFGSHTGVLAATGGTVLGFCLAGLVPGCSKYLPTHLLDGQTLIQGAGDPRSYLVPVLFSLVLSVLCLAVSLPLWNKRRI